MGDAVGDTEVDIYKKNYVCKCVKINFLIQNTN